MLATTPRKSEAAALTGRDGLSTCSYHRTEQSYAYHKHASTSSRSDDRPLSGTALPDDLDPVAHSIIARHWFGIEPWPQGNGNGGLRSTGSILAPGIHLLSTR
jgi:hypothetical protein